MTKILIWNLKQDSLILIQEWMQGDLHERLQYLLLIVVMHEME